MKSKEKKKEDYKKPVIYVVYLICINTATYNIQLGT